MNDDHDEGGHLCGDCRGDDCGGDHETPSSNTQELVFQIISAAREKSTARLDLFCERAAKVLEGCLPDEEDESGGDDAGRPWQDAWAAACEAVEDLINAAECADGYRG